MPLLYTKNLSIGYRGKALLSNINLVGEQGSMISIIGQNGMGKTTLMRTLTGLLKPIEGSVFVDDEPLEKISYVARAKKISLVLTDNISVEHLTVRELVQMGRFPFTSWVGKMSKEDEQIVDNVLDSVGITHLADCYIDQLSDGQKQRAVIGRALAQDTPIVMLDEPTSHLDMPSSVDIMLLIKSLSKSTGKLFILITHSLDLALQLSDSLWLMTEKGVECGTKEELMQDNKINEAFQTDHFLFEGGSFRIKVE